MQFKSQKMASQKISYYKTKLRYLGFILVIGLELRLILGLIEGLIITQYVTNISFPTNVYFES